MRSQNIPFGKLLEEVLWQEEKLRNVLRNMWVSKKKEKEKESKTRVHPQQSRIKMLHKPNMVGQGENHHEVRGTCRGP